MPDDHQKTSDTSTVSTPRGATPNRGVLLVGSVLLRPATRVFEVVAVLVDTANAVTGRITRPIGYVHIPIVPEHDQPEDFAPLLDLKLPPETNLYLGLLNLSDGIEGARRRIALAEAVRPDFGIAFFCGLGMPPAESVPLSARADRATSAEYNPGLRRATPETIAAVLDLHRAVGHQSQFGS